MVGPEEVLVLVVQVDCVKALAIGIGRAPP